jgi:hypothetical protein
VQDFDPATTVLVSMRLPNTVTGWLRGRLQAPEINVEPVSTGINRLTVSGKVVTVPKFWGQVKFGDITPGMKSFTPPNLGELPSNNSGGQVEGMFNVVQEFRPFVGDKAAGKQVVWAVANTAYRDGNNCLADTSRLLGLVTTNAMVYAGGAPQFREGFLEYKVAGMHYASNGELERGVYDLQMRSDVARCLYGFSTAPVSASISVISDNGVQAVATTIFGEKDGWLRLGAYGFTFSSPTIRVTLSQEQPKPVVEPTPTSTVQPVANPKKTIVCVKGKATKKVTAASPRCPIGWRKK